MYNGDSGDVIIIVKKLFIEVEDCPVPVHNTIVISLAAHSMSSVHVVATSHCWYGVEACIFQVSTALLALKGKLTFLNDTARLTLTLWVLQVCPGITNHHILHLPGGLNDNCGTPLQRVCVKNDLFFL